MCLYNAKLKLQIAALVTIQNLSVAGDTDFALFAKKFCAEIIRVVTESKE